jgi:hypothetical protein
MKQPSARSKNPSRYSNDDNDDDDGDSSLGCDGDEEKSNQTKSLKERKSNDSEDDDDEDEDDDDDDNDDDSGGGGNDDEDGEEKIAESVTVVLGDRLQQDKGMIMSHKIPISFFPLSSPAAEGRYCKCVVNRLHSGCGACSSFSFISSYFSSEQSG